MGCGQTDEWVPPPAKPPPSRRQVLSPFIHRVYGRWPALGPVLYVSTIQFFVVQLVVALRFSPSYSLAHDTISDLGNTSCGIFNGRAVCSPLHVLMNVSFIVLGLTMVVGSLLVCCALARNRGTTLAFVLMAIGGLGALLVGLFPENTVPAFHGIGTALPLLFGNLAVLILGFRLEVPRALRNYSLLTGAVALVILGFYASGNLLRLGEGGVERAVAYPQVAWMIVIGLYCLRRTCAHGLAKGLPTPR